MTPWRFSTQGLSAKERDAAWANAMRRLRLPNAGSAALKGANGSVMVVVSPMGFEFALLESGPQTISGSHRDQDSGIWLSILLKGEGVLESADMRAVLGPETILYGATGAAASLTLRSAYKMLFVKIPQVAINPRLIAPIGARVGVLAGQGGAQHVFASLLIGAGDVLDTLPYDQLRALELSIIEFLVTCLASDGRVQSKGGAAGARASHLHRICQMIETMLADPALTLDKVALEHGISPRYLQRMFTASGDTFGNYLKVRRLERCYADLISPLYMQLSISEISFRWGFNGSAHFSRSFRERYGISPRMHRQSALECGAAKDCINSVKSSA